MLWAKVDLVKCPDDEVRQKLLVVTVNGLKRIVLQSLPELQVINALFLFNRALYMTCSIF